MTMDLLRRRHDEAASRYDRYFRGSYGAEKAVDAAEERLQAELAERGMRFDNRDGAWSPPHPRHPGDVVT